MNWATCEIVVTYLMGGGVGALRLSAVATQYFFFVCLYFVLQQRLYQIQMQCTMLCSVFNRLAFFSGEP